MIIINPTQDELDKANTFMSKYKVGSFGKNVLGVSEDEFYHFIRIGKLCEITFTNYLIQEGVSINNKDMLVPCEDEFRQGADFILIKTNQEVDIKAGNKPFHTRLLIREDQFQAHIHDIYIGARWVSDNKIEFYGYEMGSLLKNITPANFGTGPCRHKKLAELKPIERFIELAKAGNKIN